MALDCHARNAQVGSRKKSPPIAKPADKATKKYPAAPAPRGIGTAGCSASKMCFAFCVVRWPLLGSIQWQKAAAGALGCVLPQTDCNRAVLLQGARFRYTIQTHRAENLNHASPIRTAKAGAPLPAARRGILRLTSADRPARNNAARYWNWLA